MLNAFLSIQDYSFLGLKLINVDNLSEMTLKFILNIVVVVFVSRFLYYPITRRKDFLFTFVLISVLVFMLCFLLANVKLQIGFAFGLFATFGILRYRTNAIPFKEMTYLFVMIGVSVINALAGKKISWAELLFTNLVIVFIIYGLEKIWLLRQELVKTVVYEKIDMIVPEKRAELLKDLEVRTGLKISRIEIGRVNFLRDTVRILVYYYDDINRINLADEMDFQSGSLFDNQDDD
jgi:hypothetical protein